MRLFKQPILIMIESGLFSEFSNYMTNVFKLIRISLLFSRNQRILTDVLVLSVYSFVSLKMLDFELLHGERPNMSINLKINISP